MLNKGAVLKPKDWKKIWYKEIVDYIFSSESGDMIFIGTSAPTPLFDFKQTLNNYTQNFTISDKYLQNNKQYLPLKFMDNYFAYRTHNDRDVLIYEEGSMKEQNLLTVDNRLKYPKTLKKYKELLKDNNCLNIFIIDNIDYFMSRNCVFEAFKNKFKKENKDIFDSFIFFSVSRGDLFKELDHHVIDVEVYNKSKTRKFEYIYFYYGHKRLLVKKEEDTVNMINNALALNLSLEDAINYAENMKEMKQD